MLLLLNKEEIMSLHAQLIDKFGGIHGVRDEAGLEAALSAPAQRVYYEDADLVVCAATYAYHLTKAHAFLDGNKRIAAAAAELFLGLNDARLRASDQELIAFFLDIAAGNIDRDQAEAQFREWTILSDA